jgi:hypothetical protein
VIRLLMLALSLALVAPACQTEKKRKGEGKPLAQQPPEVQAVTAAFDQLQKALRAGDAKAAWALFSDEMRQGMGMKMQAILEKTDEVLQKQYGATKADLQGLSGVQIYAKLLATDQLEKKLAADGDPKIYRVHRETDGKMRIFYRIKSGECSQLFVEVEGAWKADRSPNCKK